MKNIKVRVCGKVQGVWFRQSTREQAETLNIVGYAHNLPSGDVEVHAVGEDQQIQQLIDYLYQGPELANVSEVIIDECDLPAPQKFTTG